MWKDVEPGQLAAAFQKDPPDGPTEYGQILQKLEKNIFPGALSALGMSIDIYIYIYIYIMFFLVAMSAIQFSNKLYCFMKTSCTSCSSPFFLVNIRGLDHGWSYQDAYHLYKLSNCRSIMLFDSNGRLATSPVYGLLSFLQQRSCHPQWDSDCQHRICGTAVEIQSHRDGAGGCCHGPSMLMMSWWLFCFLKNHEETGALFVFFLRFLTSQVSSI